uniref:Methyltransferase domain-containing protein n=1 Tax=Chromera velia CCMP2878 TaxID=1169474 RepID=A0A0G4GTT2_9ALVE|eukprot:Cvel_23309.t1-p1 / transcript=Cvel_23309.t1 / gene=Cvel_23309 / organism=Chromera_velia_CCMP2878 / gene_product=hypothetical protein / transcript_product=hypothetical protein / location=Cvel_scaffold2387:13659-14702(-) / protein_length=348 / sequence_SO=supercontig / SO=protein_coding / is_pseudo=false
MEIENKVIGLLNSTSTTIALAIAYKTGILKVLLDYEEPLTPAAVAAVAKTDVRYTKEILAVLATGTILEIRGEHEEKYLMPLRLRGPIRNFGPYFEEMPLLCECAFSSVAAAAKTGDGIAYEKYGRFSDWMGRAADEKHRATLISKFVPAVEGGLLQSQLQKGGVEFLDVGCGEGEVLLLLAAAFPSSNFTGIDLDVTAIQVAEQRAKDRGLSNVRFVASDISAFLEAEEKHGAFDWVSAFDVIHDLSKPAVALKQIHACLKKGAGGAFLMVDIKAKTPVRENAHNSFAPFLYCVSLMHCMPVGLRDGGDGLGMMWGEEKASELLKEAGFGDVTIQEADSFNNLFVCR